MKQVCINEGKKHLSEKILGTLFTGIIVGLLAACLYYGCIKESGLLFVKCIVALIIILPSWLIYGLSFSATKNTIIDTEKNTIISRFIIGPFVYNKKTSAAEFEYVSFFMDKYGSFTTRLWYIKNKHFDLYDFDDKESVFLFSLVLSHKLNIDLLDATVIGNSQWIEKNDYAAYLEKFLENPVIECDQFRQQKHLKETIFPSKPADLTPDEYQLIVSQAKTPWWKLALAGIFFGFAIRSLLILVLQINYTEYSMEDVKLLDKNIIILFFGIILGFYCSSKLTILIDLKKEKLVSQYFFGFFTIKTATEVPQLEYVSISRNREGNYRINLWYSAKYPFTMCHTKEKKAAMTFAKYVAEKLNISLLDNTDTQNSIWIEKESI